MSDMRDKTRSRIVQVLEECVSEALEHDIAFSEDDIADRIMDGLERLLDEQDEGFVPGENEPSGENSILGSVESETVEVYSLGALDKPGEIG